MNIYKHTQNKSNNLKDNTETKRRRKLTWFNPPFSSNVSTNVGRTFLALIDKHFPRTDKLSEIIDKNTVKVSYSCMPNFKQAIINHNKCILQDQNEDKPTSEKMCNGRNREECPPDGKYLTECIVYKATITQTQSNNKETYTGLTENTFKTRYNLHKSSFKLKHKKSATGLSDHIWVLKNINIDHVPQNRMGNRKKVRPNTPDKKYCPLCLEEKFEILLQQPSLNHWKEVFSHCVHKNKYLLAEVKRKTTTPDECH